MHKKQVTNRRRAQRPRRPGRNAINRPRRQHPRPRRTIPGRNIRHRAHTTPDQIDRAPTVDVGEWDKEQRADAGEDDVHREGVGGLDDADVKGGGEGDEGGVGDGGAHGAQKGEPGDLEHDGPFEGRGPVL